MNICIQPFSTDWSIGLIEVQPGINTGVMKVRHKLIVNHVNQITAIYQYADEIDGISG